MAKMGQRAMFVVLAAFIVVLLVFVCGMRTQALAQGQPIIYPSKGQSQEQMEKDKYACYSWAKQQTGFDPMRAGATAQAPPSSQGPHGERVAGAARGAAVGAVTGAIASDAGKGAAAGAAGGAMIGGMRQRAVARQQADAQQQKAAALGQQQAGYNRAFGACLEGRGYVVK